MYYPCLFYLLSPFLLSIIISLLCIIAALSCIIPHFLCISPLFLCIISALWCINAAPSCIIHAIFVYYPWSFYVLSPTFVDYCRSFMHHLSTCNVLSLIFYVLSRCFLCIIATLSMHYHRTFLYIIPANGYLFSRPLFLPLYPMHISYDAP